MLKKLFFVALAATLMQFTAHDAHARRFVRRQATANAPRSCRQMIPLGNLIWKGCAGSGHLSRDPRGSGVALIAPRGHPLRVSSCMPIYSNTGKRIAGMQLYPGNDPRAYAWRGYSNFGCGSGKTQTSIRDASHNKPIYIQVNARQCIMIQRSYSNINSSQHC